jgi:hypothetical protein
LYFSANFVIVGNSRTLIVANGLFEEPIGE